MRLLPIVMSLGATLGCGARTPLAGSAAPDASAALDVPDAVAPDLGPPPPDGEPCAPATFTLRSRPAELVFVVDRSGSFRMGWAGVWGAFEAAIPAIDGRVTTGLLLYPDGLCEVAPGLHVPLGLGNGARIVSTLRAVTPEGRTPTRLALAAASRVLRARTSGSAGYIMLVTDGVPTCPVVGDGGDRDLEGTIAAARESAAAGVPVFVIGVGVTNVAALDAVAVAGGRPTRDARGRRHYAVDDVGSGLLEALRVVQGTVTRCELAVTPPPAGATLRVEFRGATLPEDATQRDGWWWTDARRAAITLHGPACARIVQESGDLTAQVVCP